MDTATVVLALVAVVVVSLRWVQVEEAFLRFLLDVSVEDILGFFEG